MSKALVVGGIVACMLGVMPVLAEESSSSAMAPMSSVAPDMSSSMAPDVSSSAPAALPEMPTADQATVDAWQQVISSQIQAFRVHDAPGALKYASAAFQGSFADPEKFYAAIIGSGYGPIATSKSESFGKYQLVTDATALQEVKLTNSDQSVFEAIYQMVKEEAGWRVSGVQLTKTQAIGV